jgi:hypothetical protein
MARVKETHYFDTDEYFRERTRKYDIYHSFFPEAMTGALFGEATPIYTYWPSAMRRIRDYNPRMRIIVLLRNPIARAWSHWRMERSRGADDHDFFSAIDDEEKRCRSAWPDKHRVYSYLDRGIYMPQITNILQSFPREQTRFVKSEFFFAEPQRVLDGICDFLHLDRMVFDTSMRHRTGQDQGALPATARDLMTERFAEDVLQLERTLGWDCSDWLE